MGSEDLQHFLNDEGRLTAWPAKPKKQMLALRFFAEKLEWDRLYTEQEINDLLTKFHTFGDAALLRRELYMKHFVDRKADCSAYWKTPRLLPSSWSTTRLEVRDATEHDVPVLQSVHDACAYIQDWIGNHDNRENPMLMEVRGEMLPPNGKRELQRAQAIVEKASGEVIGCVVVYHGYPDPDTLWIALFEIHPKTQRKGIGREVVSELESQVRALATFTRMGLGVGVGNDPAMEFWASCGFTNVVYIEDHGTHKDRWVVKSLKD